jgi:low affinity Fe/Cu permease
MKTHQDLGLLQTFARFSIQAIGYVVTIGLVVVLVLVWALTGPLFQLGQQFAREKTKNHTTCEN